MVKIGPSIHQHLYVAEVHVPHGLPQGCPTAVVLYLQRVSPLYHGYHFTLLVWLLNFYMKRVLPSFIFIFEDCWGPPGFSNPLDSRSFHQIKINFREIITHCTSLTAW